MHAQFLELLKEEMVVLVYALLSSSCILTVYISTMYTGELTIPFIKFCLFLYIATALWFHFVIILVSLCY